MSGDMGVTRTVVSRLELAGMQPSLDLLMRYMRAVGVDPAVGLHELAVKMSGALDGQTT